MADALTTSYRKVPSGDLSAHGCICGSLVHTLFVREKDVKAYKCFFVLVVTALYNNREFKRLQKLRRLL